MKTVTISILKSGAEMNFFFLLREQEKEMLCLNTNVEVE